MRTSKTHEERFFEKVTQEGDCWMWQAAVTTWGYGAFWLAGQNRQVQAHRWAYEFMVGEIPDSLHIDHLCKQRRCVNPYHMEPVPLVTNVMRGSSAWAVNARKTHCLRGHSLALGHYYPRINRRTGGQMRICKECTRMRNKGLL